MASPHSPGGDGPTTSGGDFDTDLLPLSSTGGDRRAGSEYDSQNEAEEDRNLFIDEEIVADAEEEEEDGEDLYPDNFMEQCALLPPAPAPFTSVLMLMHFSLKIWSQ